MTEPWVDFKTVKAAVTMRLVLDHYTVNWLQKSGKEFRGRCPIHKGDGNSFHFSPEKNAFNCFSCGKKGNVLDFVAAMEPCSVREAAVRIAGWFGVESSDCQSQGPVKDQKPLSNNSPAAKVTAEPQPPEAVPVGESEEKNKPLEFELQGVDPTHPYLLQRGIGVESAKRFGVGFFSGRGSMTGRVVIAIHNSAGKLVAYTGRSIDEKTEPKYKLPSGFKKSLELYNLHRAVEDLPDGEPIILVEGFFGCIRIDSAGFRSVALMGCSLSEVQERYLVSEFSQVVVMLDGDVAGRSAAEEISNRLKRKVFVHVIELADGQQPDHLSLAEIQSLLRGIVDPRT